MFSTYYSVRHILGSDNPRSPELAQPRDAGPGSCNCDCHEKDPATASIRSTDEVF